MVKYHHHFSS